MAYETHTLRISQSSCKNKFLEFFNAFQLNIIFVRQLRRNTSILIVLRERFFFDRNYHIISQFSVDSVIYETYLHFISKTTASRCGKNNPQTSAKCSHSHFLPNSEVYFSFTSCISTEKCLRRQQNQYFRSSRVVLTSKFEGVGKTISVDN